MIPWALALHAGHMVGFAMLATSGDPARARWRVGILACHAALCAFHLGVFSISRTVSQRPLIALVAPIYLVAGAALAMFDQAITPAITPFLVANAVVAALFRLPTAQFVVNGVGGFVALVGLLAFAADRPLDAPTALNAALVVLAAITFGASATSAERRDLVQRRTISFQRAEIERALNEARAQAERANALQRAMQGTASLDSLPPAPPSVSAGAPTTPRSAADPARR